MRLRLQKAGWSALTCAIVLTVFAFAQAGVAYFRELIGGATIFMLTVAAAAFLIRFTFHTGGMLVSLLYGFVVAIIGYFAVIAYATSRI